VDHKKIHFVLSVICTLFLCTHSKLQGIRQYRKNIKDGCSLTNCNVALIVICKYKIEDCVTNQVLVRKITIDNFLLTAKTFSTCMSPGKIIFSKNVKIWEHCSWYRYIIVMRQKLKPSKNKINTEYSVIFIKGLKINYRKINLTEVWTLSTVPLFCTLWAVANQSVIMVFKINRV